MHHEDIYPRLRRGIGSPPPLREIDLDREEDLDFDDDDDGGAAHGPGSFLEALAPEEATSVSDIMTKNVFCATPDMSLDSIAYVMLDQCISGAPVVDEAGRPIGVISKTDVLRELRELSEIDRATWRQWDGPSTDARSRCNGMHMDSLGERSALDAMTPIVYWLPEDASISQAAALMAYERVHRIPIVNKTGRVVGLVSTLDILRWLASRKGYLIPR